MTLEYINPYSVPSYDMPGYYIHPDFPSYATNREGKVWSMLNNSFITPFKNHNGYYAIRLVNRNKETKGLLLHRLIAYHFVPLPPEFNGNYDLATIDHVDGNKLNNHYTNLEWVTLEENSRRAWAIGLQDHQYKPCFIIDLYNRTYNEFRSLADLSIYLNKPTKALTMYFHKFSGVLEGRYIIGLLDDPKWKDVALKLDAVMNEYINIAKSYCPKVVFDTETGEDIQFNTLNEIAEYYNCPKSTVRSAYNGGYLLRKRYRIEPLVKIMNEFNK